MQANGSIQQRRFRHTKHEKQNQATTPIGTKAKSNAKAKAKANFASDLPLDTVRDLVGAFRLAIPGTTKFIQISIFNWRKFDLIMKNEKFKFWLDFVRKMLQFRVRTARDTHEMPPNSLLAWPNLVLPSPGLSGSVKGLPLYMFEQQLLL